MGGPIIYKWPLENRLDYFNRPKTWLLIARRIHKPKKKHSIKEITAKIKWKIN